MKNKLFKTIYLICFLFITLNMVFLTLHFLIPELRPAVKIDNKIIDTLYGLIKISEMNKEYPAGAVLVYSDSIIGSGYNTLFANIDPTGHAEINAIKDAFSKMGKSKFNLLNREKLILYTSNEPCIMCRGVINNYKINRIYFIKPKPFRFQWYYKRNEIILPLKMRKIKTD
jgi:tRNA(Arg) A34 adenosine deaminase TadA